MGQLKYKNTSLSQVPLLISPKAESKVELGECWIQGYLEAAAGWVPDYHSEVTRKYEPHTELFGLPVHIKVMLILPVAYYVHDSIMVFLKNVHNILITFC